MKTKQTFNVSSDQRLMFRRALAVYVEHLEAETLSTDPDLAEWASVELEEVGAMRRQLQLED